MSRLAELCQRAQKTGNGNLLVEHIPYARFLGIRQTQSHAGSDDNAVRFELPFSEHLIGNTRLPALHGGVVAAFLEHAALLHLLISLRAQKMPKSIDFSIDYLRSARPITLLAQCEITRLGRRVAQLQVKGYQDGREDAEKPRLVALARAHFLLSELEQPPDAAD